MREIKFRAWNVNTKRMANWEEVRDEYGFLHLLENRITVPLQFTGLHDKNGTEIFEGDILITNNKAVGQVLWDRDSYIARVEDARWSGIRDETLGYAQEMEIEIIGNIFENPELLKAA